LVRQRSPRPRAVAALFVAVGGLFALAPAVAQARALRGSFGSGQLTNPVGVAVDQSSGDVYVGNLIAVGNDKYDAFGNLLSPPSPFGGSNYSGVAVNPTNGQVYVVDARAQAVDTFDPSTGALLSSFSVPGSANLFGAYTVVQIASDAAGNVYVPNAPNNEVQEYSSTGTLLNTFSGSGAAALSAPTGVAVDGSGNVWVSDTGNGRVEEFDPTGVAVDGSGNVWVSDTGNGRVEAFDPTGATVLTTITSPGVEDVAVDSAGDVYASVSGASGSHVIEYDSTGTQIDDFGLGTIGTSGFGSPNSIAVNNTAVYVADGGNNVVWIFGPPVPSVTTTATTNLTATSATLNGTVNPNGLAVSDCHFEYGTDNSYSKTAACAQTPAAIGSGTSPVPVSADLAGLQPNTVYHFRLDATDANGPGYSPDQTFETGASVGGESVSAVGTTYATLNARINPNGADTTYHFEYGSAGPCSSNPCASAPVPDVDIGSGRSDVSVSQQVAGLSPGTTYYYRVVAQIPGGSTDGADQSFATFAPATAGLPDGRVYEQVSPQQKNGNEAGIQLSAAGSGNALSTADGGKVVYFQYGPAGSGSSGSSTYLVSARSASGWVTSEALPPGVGINADSFFGETPNVMIFSPDLSHFVFSSVGTYSSQNPQAPQSNATGLYRTNGNSSEPDWLTEPVDWQSSGHNPPFPVVPGPGSINTVNFLMAGGTQDLGNVYFTYYGTLTPQDASRAPNVDPTADSRGPWGFYQWDQGTLTTAGQLPDGSYSPWGAVPAVTGRDTGPNRWDGVWADNQVSQDASKAFFVSPDPLFASQAGTPTELYVRETAADGSQKTVLVSKDAVAGGGPAPAAGDGNAVEPVNTTIVGTTYQPYVFASRDGSKAFFASQDQLTGDAPNDASVKEYEFDVSTGALSYLTGVVGPIIAAADDGSSFVFDDTQTNQLELWSQGSSPKPVAGYPSGTPTFGGVGATADGSAFVFNTDAVLSGAGGEAFNNSAGTFQVYRYDTASGTLSCLSCAPTGGTQSPAEIAQAHLLADGGSRVFFDTAAKLVAQDVNGVNDVYEWEADGTGSCDSAARAGGCIFLISSGQVSRPSFVLDASSSGNDVFFTTADGLAPSDTDRAYDVYDARVGGGFPTSVTASCAGDACQGAPTAPPTLPLAGTVMFTGPGNATQALTARVRVTRKALKGSRFVLSVKVPADGRIQIFGADVKTVSRSVSRAGTYRLTVMLNQQAKQTLKRRRRLRVSVDVLYTPRGGRPSLATVAMVVKARSAR
jgi:DNA-binding beta-propeller fold protein YncE